MTPRPGCYLLIMKTNFIEEHKLAERIINKHLRRMSAIALEKGYNGLPFVNREGEAISGEGRVGYVILGSKGSKFNIRILSGNDEKEVGSMALLDDTGATFSRYARIVLDDIEDKIKQLPSDNRMAHLFDVDTIEAAARFFHKVITGEKGSAHLLGIMTRPDQIPIVGDLPVGFGGIRRLTEDDISEIVRAVSSQNVANLQDMTFHTLHSIYAIAPFMQGKRLFGALQSYTESNKFSLFASFRLFKSDLFKQLIEAYRQFKNCGTFEEIIQQKVGDISLLTKSQQESFVDNIRRVLSSMPPERFDVHRGISIDLAGGQNNDQYHPLNAIRSDLKRTNKKTDTSELMRNILETICGLKNEDHAWQSCDVIDSRHIKMGLKVPLPLTLGGGEAEFGYPCNGSSARWTIDQLIKNAIRYGHFLDLIEGAADTGESLDRTTEAVIQGFARVVDGLIEKMTTGPNAMLVSIMKGETKIIRSNRQKKEYSEKDRINKVAAAIAAGIHSCISMIQNAREAGLISVGTGNHEISFEVNGWEPFQIKFCIKPRSGGWDDRTVYPDKFIQIHDGSGEEPLFKIPGYSASRSGIAEATTKCVRENPDSNFVSLLDSCPDQLAKSIQLSFEEYVESNRSVFESRIEQEKESFYRAFQDDFPEELFEQYCTGPGM